MSDKLTQIEGKEAFDNFLDENKDSYILVDFWAEWCGPCRAVAPIVDEIAEKLGEEVKVAKVDVDQNQELSMEYNVMSIPTLMLVKPAAGAGNSDDDSDDQDDADADDTNGEVEREHSLVIGFRPKPAMAQWLESEGVNVEALAA